MTALNRPARLNRVLLALCGLLLLAGGGFVCATHYGRLTVLDRDAALVPGTATPPTWVLYVSAGAAIVIGLLALRWLAAQFARRPRTRTWRLERDPDQGRTELAASTATEPFVGEVATYEGVRAAHATLAGTRRAPVLAVVISADQSTDLGAVRARLDTEGLPRLRQALDLETLPVTVEFRFATASGDARVLH
ncbi:Asp23/Gls24 family envelope stress response protein [Streptomyces corynorhini]|uniref:Alkaline shock response membrane anchor protein AmaP n=1 Tax=Streptomyces corynorhini TaxID=2282652 RepID=A0A370AY12_9ACTN|nr:alkaline shock response membrane anchor protein AmaP [Streptomyces corynorhini]RDG34527.1 alkaline shock response membrane anchor protein AmaP [Streptomyces corynorhini]